MKIKYIIAAAAIALSFHANAASVPTADGGMRPATEHNAFTARNAGAFDFAALTTAQAQAPAFRPGKSEPSVISAPQAPQTRGEEASALMPRRLTDAFAADFMTNKYKEAQRHLTRNLSAYLDEQNDKKRNDVPEPAALALFGLSMLGLGLNRRRKRRLSRGKAKALDSR